MAARVPGVLASFDHLDAAVEAVHRLKAEGHTDLTVYTAAPNHELEAAVGRPVSWVRLFTLIGALSGCAAGFGMTTWMSYDWPLLVGGKPISSIPPYVVIMFELTILLGALSTVAGMLILSLRDSTKGRPFHPRFTDDRVGVFAACGPERAEGVTRIFTGAGAVEVSDER